MTTEYKYSLQKYQGRRTRHTCPNCGKPNEFTVYVDEAGDPLAAHVGKCNRENNCGYHYPPGDYFRDNPQAGDGDGEEWRQSDAWKTTFQPPKPQPVDFLSREALEASLKHYDKNNFVRYLAKLFGQQKALELAQAYQLGTSKRWKNAGGLSVVFWQVDRAGNIRQAKAMAYNPQTGRRLKEEGKHYVSFLGKKILKNREANLQQCLFGEHLLAQAEGKTACLVESEKTAVIMAGIAPNVVWLATGGKNGAKWTDRSVYKALTGRTVILYPDLGAFKEWQSKAKILGTVCTYEVSSLLEDKAQGEDRKQGFDLADYFVKRLQNGVYEPQPREEPEQAQENGLTRQPEDEVTQETRQDAGDAGPGDGTPGQGTPGDAAGGLPAGFNVVGKTLEVDGLPMAWLNEEERAAAHERMKGKELEVMAALNPAITKMVERFGLEAI